MGSGGVNLETHSLALLAAKGDVASGRAAASWALFSYEKANELKLLDSGAGGPDELARRFQSGSVMYGLCRLPDAATGQQHVVLISWVGEKVSEQQKQACAGHLPAIRAFFKEARLVVKASRAEEVTQEGLRHSLPLAAPPGGPEAAKKAPLGDPQELVGTNYKKTNPALEILRTKRDSFWAQAEREEEQRREEERRRAQEERRRWERQRMEEERREAAERERRVQEKEQLVQEQRKQQAQLEAEERRREQARWEQQQQERAKALAEQSPLSGSAEKATEAAALASQRPHDPRDFFHQRERSGSAVGAPESPSPTGGRPGPPRRPFLRHQRSLTESAYIFRGPDAAPARRPSGDFLPSPRSPQAAPLPSPRLPKTPPARNQDPEPRSPPPPALESRTPLAPSPPGGSPTPLLAPALLDSGDPARTQPLAEALAPPEALRGPPPHTLPAESGPQSPFAPHGAEGTPCIGHSDGMESPLLGSAPRAKYPPPAHVPHSLPTETGSAGSSARGVASPLGSPPEEALPHAEARDLASFQGPDFGGTPTAGAPEAVDGCEFVAPPLGKDPVTDPLPAPDSAPYSGFNGTSALEEESWPAGQGTPSVEAKLPEESTWDPRAGGSQAPRADSREEGEDPSLPTARAGED
ncbi:drebrin-like protein isoform X2 [Podarcis lilfordi]|uniref:Drebrin n=1 Tax=Podarcis lilfordi TaxID=74358 RepID=A0AA35KVH2_9SAUR|nr:drebrin-like protein isoform X2 [Podarcis lilfordi]